MTIKTKYGIDDTVFFMYKNKVQSGKIKDIKIHIYISEGVKQLTTTLNYYMVGHIEEFDENQLAITKEKLLKLL